MFYKLGTVWTNRNLFRAHGYVNYENQQQFISCSWVNQMAQLAQNYQSYVAGSQDSIMGTPPVPKNDEGPVVTTPLNAPQISAPPPMLPMQSSNTHTPIPTTLSPVQNSVPPQNFLVKNSSRPLVLVIQNSPVP
ncbi:uncharacterized protein LOC113287794 isoform X1 [Papaver somniferum]|uniref:uncharacterized protein LOC113287794 isoform X1 n=1 Tax=Papaver somniferum TaxID=3469 RepID=UPI000E6F4912|nr:uncharacterized protein LOC113287794 isoform X1 [Papaver somniferum]